MAEETLKTLFIAELRDLLDSENQLVKAIPKIAEKANSPNLRSALEEHLEQTKNHATRLEQVLQGLGEKPKGVSLRALDEFRRQVAKELELPGPVGLDPGKVWISDLDGAK